jgi:hypothetical protein
MAELYCGIQGITGIPQDIGPNDLMFRTAAIPAFTHAPRLKNLDSDPSSSRSRSCARARSMNTAPAERPST